MLPEGQAGGAEAPPARLRPSLGFATSTWLRRKALDQATPVQPAHGELLSAVALTAAHRVVAVGDRNHELIVARGVGDDERQEEAQPLATTSLDRTRSLACVDRPVRGRAADLTRLAAADDHQTRLRIGGTSETADPVPHDAVVERGDLRTDLLPVLLRVGIGDAAARTGIARVPDLLGLAVEGQPEADHGDDERVAGGIVRVDLAVGDRVGSVVVAGRGEHRHVRGERTSELGVHRGAGVVGPVGLGAAPRDRDDVAAQVDQVPDAMREARVGVDRDADVDRRTRRAERTVDIESRFDIRTLRVRRAGGAVDLDDLDLELAGVAEDLGVGRGVGQLEAATQRDDADRGARTVIVRSVEDGHQVVRGEGLGGGVLGAGERGGREQLGVGRLRLVTEVRAALGQLVVVTRDRLLVDAGDADDDAGFGLQLADVADPALDDGLADVRVGRDDLQLAGLDGRLDLAHRARLGAEATGVFGLVGDDVRVDVAGSDALDASSDVGVTGSVIARGEDADADLLVAVHLVRRLDTAGSVLGGHDVFSFWATNLVIQRIEPVGSLGR